MWAQFQIDHAADLAAPEPGYWGSNPKTVSTVANSSLAEVSNC